MSRRLPQMMHDTIDGVTVCTARAPREPRHAWAARHYVACARVDRRAAAYWLQRAAEARAAVPYALPTR